MANGGIDYIIKIRYIYIRKNKYLPGGWGWRLPVKYLMNREERMKRVRINRRKRSPDRPHIPRCLQQIGCSVLRKQMIVEYVGMIARGEQVRANNLTRQFLRNKDLHVETWRERNNQKVTELYTTGAYTLNRSLPNALSFTKE